MEYYIRNFHIKEEKVYMGNAESFGRLWQVGDVVGVFLDLLDHTISKTYNFFMLFVRVYLCMQLFVRF